jgi:hypothetical protein
MDKGAGWVMKREMKKMFKITTEAQRAQSKKTTA